MHAGGKHDRERRNSDVGDLFLRRIEDVERRVRDELERPLQAAGPWAHFVRDVVGELWSAGSAAAATVLEPAKLRGIAASWVAAPSSDGFGVDPALARNLRHLILSLSSFGFGLEPVDGRDLHDTASGETAGYSGTLVLFNRSAWPLPVEALVLWALVAEAAGGHRPVYALWPMDALEGGLVAEALAQVGIFPASPDNCAALLAAGATVVAFPEGVGAADKGYEQRYRLARFEDAELITAAATVGARIVPAAVIGNEESYPVLGHVAGLPVTPLFPLAGLLGLLPLPFSWTAKLGGTIEYSATADPLGLADAVRARMQALLLEMVSKRASVLFG